MDELPTDKTEIMTTTFITDGSPEMPAFCMDMTKGDALASDEALPLRSRGSL